MMTKTQECKQTLDAAYLYAAQHLDSTCKHSAFIDYVINNTHLTYKYVLFTALLSKATYESINPLCLQAKSKLPGAYDARSICHKVIVEFEKNTLKKVLGGSNEPFLNKPARFTELSKNNAVRKGNDQNILFALCDNLPTIETKSDAYECLVYLLCKLIKLRDKQETLTVFRLADSSDLPARLYTFICKALEHSFSGAVLTLVIAGLYHLLYSSIENSLVEVHPINQSGASTKEISDLDIYVNNELILSIELKDKIYAETDVCHAVDKVILADGKTLLFIEGPRAHATEDFKEIIENRYLDLNFLLSIESYDSHIKTMLNLIPTIDCEEFIRFILYTAHETKFKADVIDYFDKLAETEFGLAR